MPAHTWSLLQEQLLMETGKGTSSTIYQKPKRQPSSAFWTVSFPPFRSVDAASLLELNQETQWKLHLDSSCCLTHRPILICTLCWKVCDCWHIVLKVWNCYPLKSNMHIIWAYMDTDGFKKQHLWGIGCASMFPLLLFKMACIHSMAAFPHCTLVSI